MRRRRLIGIYRGLRKSMYAVAFVHSGSAVRAGRLEEKRTICPSVSTNLSDRSREHNRAAIRCELRRCGHAPTLIWSFSRDMQDDMHARRHARARGERGMGEDEAPR